MEQLDGKVAVITGAANGIGLAMARAFAKQGSKLVLADVNGDELAAAVASLEADGATATGEVTDVSEIEQVEALRDAALGAYGAVHVVCNNAGVGGGGLSWEIPMDQWRWVLGVDLFGVIHGVKTFTPLLVEQGEGHVVNTASMAGLTSPGFMGPYNVSKHGVVTLSETMYGELSMMAPGVGVSVLCPGWVNTRVYDAARYRTDDEEQSEASQAAAEGLMDVVKGLVTSGLDPSVVADQVVDAVLTRRFYILTHPSWNDAITDRTATIVSGENPGPMSLPSENAG